MRIAVLGVGLIGGSVGLAAREALDDVEVSGFDSSPEALEAAAERRAVDSAAASVEDAVRGADACFICVPVGAIPGLLDEALAAAPRDCLVTDVGSTKQRIVGGTEDERFIGGHPVAGTDGTGVGHARADLFQGSAWYLTPLARSSGLLYERLHRLLVSFGAHPVAIDPETHDRLLATVSHLPHVVANALVSQAARALSEEGEALPRVGPSFRDATRVAGANSAVWADIYLTNAEAIRAEIDETIARLREAAKVLDSGDREAVLRWNESAGEARRRLLEADLAGGPVYELHLTVPNRPGIVAQVALALGRGGVNILDMALAPAADMRSGAITIWIAGEEPAERGRVLVEQLGFPCTLGRGP